MMLYISQSRYKFHESLHLKESAFSSDTSARTSDHIR